MLFPTEHSSREIGDIGPIGSELTASAAEAGVKREAMGSKQVGEYRCECGLADLAGFGGMTIVQFCELKIPIGEVKRRPGWSVTERREDVRG